MGRVEKYQVELIGLSDEFDVLGEGESRKILRCSPGVSGGRAWQSWT